MREQPKDALIRELAQLRQQVGELKRRDRESARTRARLEQLCDNSPQAIVLLDNADRVVNCNPRFCELFGFRPDEARNVPLNSLIVPPDRADEGAGMSQRVLQGGTVATEVVRQHKDGSLIEVRVLGYPIQLDDEQIGIWAIYDDLSSIKRDRLTKLPTKSVFLDSLALELKRSLGNGTLVAVLIMDLDRFKDVNDSYGLPLGDELLRGVVDRLEGTLRNIAGFGRLGPDEFGFLQTDIRDVGSADGLARRLLEAVREPFQFDGLTLHLTASIGIALSLWEVPAAQELERQAQRALTLAKEGGGDTYRVFTPSLDRATRDRMVLGQDLYGSWERQELFLEYQPQVRIDSSSIVGAEALVRWNHPQQGRLGPDRFIPVAEATGAIVPIGDWVLRAATVQAKSWEESFGHPIPVAVNLSAVQFRDPTLPQRVERALEASALDAGSLELEITESVFVEFDDQVVSTLDQFEQIGVGICLDDFGKGYSSLNYLRRLRLQRLKIDRSFVANISPGGQEANIVSAIAALGSKLGIDVLAEGVETREQLDFVQAEGCQNVQGFYYSPAVSAVAFADLMMERGGLVQPSAGD